MRTLALLAAVALAATAHADHPSDLPLLDGHAYAGDAWAAWRIAVPEGGARIEVEPGAWFAPGAAAQVVGMGAWVVRDDGSAAGAVASRFFVTVNNHEVHAQALDPVGTLMSTSAGSQGVTVGGSHLLALDLEAGEHVVVAMVARDSGGIHGDLLLHAAPGVALLGRTTGDDAWLLRDRDFEGAANAYVQHAAGPMAKAAALGEAHRTTEALLFARFWGTTNTQALLMSYDGPGGPREGATDYLFTGAPAGDHVFRVDAAADLGGSNSAVVTLLGADVRTP